MRKKWIGFFIVLSLMFGLNIGPVHGAGTKWVSGFSTNQKTASTYDVDEEGAGVAIDGTIHVQGIEKDDDGYAYAWQASNDDVTLSDPSAKDVDIKGVSVGDVTLTQTIYQPLATSQTPNSSYREDTDAPFALNLSSVVMMPNDTVTLKANKTVTWSSSDENIVKVNAGQMTAISIGQAVITATDASGQSVTCHVIVGGNVVETHTMNLTVTNPQLHDVLYAIQFYEANYGTLQMEGASSEGAERVIYGTSNPNVILDEEGNFRVYKNLDADLYAYVDGKLLTAKMKITHPIPASLRDTILKKGMSKTINPLRFSGLTTVDVSGTSTDALTFDQNVVTANDYGKLSTMITGDNASFVRDFWCVNDTTYNIMKQAFKIYDQKRHYSQPKRTQKRYVDCSSYVWRVYKQAGFTLGSKYYPPTAAEEARFLSKKKRLSAPTKSRIDALKPGDLLFYSSKKNGRYKNITHVELYVSSGASLGASGPYYGDEGGCVAQGTSVNSNLVAIGRLYDEKTDRAPRASKIKSIKAKKNKVKVSWAKTLGSGVTLQLSQSKAFNKKTKTIKVSRLKTSSTIAYTTSKKVYVRLRAYKAGVGRTYYSSWSSVRRAK